MRTENVSLSVCVLLLMACASVSAQFPESPPELKPGDIQPIPWSDSAEHVRVPKALLPHLVVEATRFWMPESGLAILVLTDEFAVGYRLTPAEAAALRGIVTNAQHELRLTQARHRLPMPKPAVLHGYQAPDGLRVVEAQSFQLEPFADEVAKLDKSVRQSVSKVLGTERAGQFWALSPKLSSQLAEQPHQAGKDGQFRPPFTNQTTFTYRLIEYQSALSVDQVHISQTWRTDGRMGGSSSSSGGPLFEAEDPYVPDALKPALRRWRAAIAEYVATNKPANTSRAAVNPPASMSRPLELSAGTGSPWEDGVPFVRIPKREMRALGVSALTFDGELSVAAAILFDLTPDQARSVAALYAEMRERFETYEKAYLERDRSGPGRFVLRPLVDTTRVLQEEWRNKLKALVGAGRGELLDQAIRTPVREGSPAPMPRSRRPFHFMPQSRWCNWLVRGTNEVHFVARLDHGPTGASQTHVEWTVSVGGSKESNEWSASGGLDRLPWGHLFGPEIFTLP